MGSAQFAVFNVEVERGAFFQDLRSIEGGDSISNQNHTSTPR